jgi:glycerol-3-phosphate dehydrogenase (NAD(P)+)
VGSYAVIGATSWGVTLAWLLANNGHDITLVTRDREEERLVGARRGLARLPEVRLSDRVTVLHASAAAGSPDGIVVAVPAQSLRETLPASHFGRVPILSAAKGIEHGTGMLMSDVLRDLGWRNESIAVISGPNLAHEVARGLPAAAVVASSGPGLAGDWQRALSGGAFRAYTSDDVVGVELGGAFKNVIAIAAGAAWGLSFGANAVATIMTRGLAEMTRLGTALGARPLTFQGLAGVGDLAATCFSPLSRNRRLGELLAKGRTLQEALDAIGEAVEGATTAPVALALAKRHAVELPIAEQVAAVLGGNHDVRAAMTELLSRPLKREAGELGG